MRKYEERRFAENILGTEDNKDVDQVNSGYAEMKERSQNSRGKLARSLRVSVLKGQTQKLSSRTFSSSTNFA